MTTPDRLLFVEDVATLLNRTPASVRWMVKHETAPPSAMIGGRRCFRESEVHAWINAQFEKEYSND